MVQLEKGITRWRVLVKRHSQGVVTHVKGFFHYGLSQAAAEYLQSSMLYFFRDLVKFLCCCLSEKLFFSRPFKPLPSRTRCESGNGSEWASADAPDVLCDRWAWLVSHVGGDLHAKGKKQKNKTKTKKTGDSDLLTVVSYDIVWKPYCSTVVGVPGCFFFSYVNMCDVTIIQPSCQNKYWQIGICITKIS